MSQKKASAVPQFSSRDEIDEKYKWDLSSMCKDNQDLIDKCIWADKLIDELSALQDSATTSSAHLLGFLERFDELFPPEEMI